MACVGLLSCFSCVRAKQRKRSAEAFLAALRDGDECAAALRLQETPTLVKGLNLINKKNALHVAVEEGQLVVLTAVVEAVLIAETQSKHGEDGIKELLNGQDASGRTPLFIACAYGHADCARFLMSNGADRNIADCHGNVPLHMACLRNHLGLIFMLLSEFSAAGGSQTPSNVNVTNDAGLTPLHMAVWGRHSGAVQVLLQHGADINVRTVQDLPDQQTRTWPSCVSGTTPLHSAAARGHVEICKILLKTFYERVLEPEMLRRTRNLPPLVSDLSSVDPRLQTNSSGKMPYQIARHLGLIPLSMLLRPSVSLALLFGDEERNNNSSRAQQGPPSLKILATEALNRSLASMVRSLLPPPAGPVPSSRRHPSAMRRQRPAALVLPAPVQAVGTPLIAGAQTQVPPLSAQQVTSPRSPGLLSPSTPSLQAGRWPAQRDETLNRALSRGTEGAEVLLPGMVGGSSSSLAASGRSHPSQTRSPVEGGMRARRSPPQVVFSTTNAAFPMLEVQADDSPLRQRHVGGAAPDLGSSGAHDVDVPLTPSPVEFGGREAASTAGLTSRDARPGRGRGHEAVGGSGDHSLDPIASGRITRRGLRSRGHVSDTGQARSARGYASDAGASGPVNMSASTSAATSRHVSISGRIGETALGRQPGQDDTEGRGGMRHRRPDSPSGVLSAEPSRMGSITGRAAAQDAAAMLMESTQGPGEDAVMSGASAKPGKQTAPQPASTCVVAADGFEVSSVDNECGICLENAPTIAVKPCLHLVCGTCALKMCTAQVQKPSHCPFCRGLIHGFVRAPGAGPCC